ncbi:MAG: DgaE family pyridoxal phosphate-dependent ammonia lyase [Acidimicrobiia bacterium]|nr:MAG: DgaE family pyridoxal phosphate-dependent ammonia lyase [Acidimicrobiia bacterium]
MSIYSELNIRPVVNASATLTVLGGSLMPKRVLEAMQGAAANFVDMHEYHVAAGQRLAELTNNEAAYVTAGCAAALSISTLACITRGDPALIARMPAGDGLPTQVIMHRSQRMPYDPALRLVGAQIVEIGNILQTFEWELESAIGPETAAVLYVAGAPYARGALALETVIEIAHQRDVPVIVDAAAQLPPASNLWHFSHDLGAELVLFSGGKGLHGPQASGLIVGQSDLIEACSMNGAPHQRLVRAMKVGKEEIAGLLKAVELYVAADHAADQKQFEAVCARWVTELSQLPGVIAVRDWPNEAGQPTPRVLVRLEPNLGVTASELVGELWEGNPRIAVAPFDATGFHITPDTLAPGEDRIVSERIAGVLTEMQR